MYSRGNAVENIQLRSCSIGINRFWFDGLVGFFPVLLEKNLFRLVWFKAGVHLKAVFWLGIMFLMQISRLRFKQSRICSLITDIYVLRRFVNFLVIFRFIWRQIVFLKGLVKFMEIGNFEDLVLF